MKTQHEHSLIYQFSCQTLYYIGLIKLKTFKSKNVIM